MSFKFVTHAAAAALIVSAAQMPVAAQTAENAEEQEEEASRLTSTTTIVCRRYPPPTGSRIGTRRVCRTQYEWQQIDQGYREWAEHQARTRRPCGSSQFPCE